MKPTTQCPHWGHGGQYQRDPVTGIRTRVEAMSTDTAVAAGQASLPDHSPAMPAVEANDTATSVVPIHNPTKKAATK